MECTHHVYDWLETKYYQMQMMEGYKWNRVVKPNGEVVVV